MTWEKELSELQRRRELVENMGGSTNIKKHHNRGKLTARERISKFVDMNSFEEIMPLVGESEYENNLQTNFLPKNSIDGFANINERRITLSAGDFTVKGGMGKGASSASAGLGQEKSITQEALIQRLPYVRLLDSAGGSVKNFEKIGRTYLPDGNSFVFPEVELLQEVPVASAVLGSVAGLPAVQAPLSHFSVMVKDISQIFPGGPPVVKAALGYDITKEELGGDPIHTRISGCIDNLADNEDEAFAQICSWLSFLPSSKYELSPRKLNDDDPDRKEESLLSIIPRSRRKTYDVKKIISLICDKDSFFEISPFYGKSRMIGFGRFDGYATGIIANNSKFMGGSTDAAGGSKVNRFLQVCDLFNIPVVMLVDEPGFLVGLDSEKQGIERAGARLMSTVCLSKMPLCTIVMSKVYGVAGQCTHRPTGMYQRICWPSANWGSMHISGGVYAAYKSEIEAAPNPEEKKKEIEARLNAITSPFRTAETTGQRIIDPRHTRSHICKFVKNAQRVLAGQLGSSRFLFLP
jgi:acetyl-CoA carboxylase carboxyltransferase component